MAVIVLITITLTIMLAAWLALVLGYIWRASDAWREDWNTEDLHVKIPLTVLAVAVWFLLNVLVWWGMFSIPV